MARFEVLKDFAVLQTEVVNGTVTSKRLNLSAGSAYDSAKLKISDKSLLAMSIGKEPIIHMDKQTVEEIKKTLAAKGKKKSVETVFIPGLPKEEK